MEEQFPLSCGMYGALGSLLSSWFDVFAWSTCDAGKHHPVAPKGAKTIWAWQLEHEKGSVGCYLLVR